MIRSQPISIASGAEWPRGLGCVLCAVLFATGAPASSQVSDPPAAAQEGAAVEAAPTARSLEAWLALALKDGQPE